MAAKLNRNRVHLSRLTMLACVVVILFSRQFFSPAETLHEMLESVGVFLTGLCAMGRLYSSAYLGGFKNQKLVTDGIYSIMRNPLYFFSLVGVLGAAFISNHLVIIIVLPLIMLALYIPLIRREEAFLTKAFGEEYTAYKKAVPALWPKFSNYKAAEVESFHPRFLTNAFWDAIWWLSILPLVEFIEYLQTAGLLPTFFVS